MKTVYTNNQIVDHKEIDQKEFFTIADKNNSNFTIVENDDDQRWSFMPFQSACKIATDKNKIVESSHFWLGNKISGFLLYIPATGKYLLKSVNKNKALINVSDETYQDCLADIADQKHQDRIYNWKAPSADYYNIENWSFNIKDGKLER